MINVIGSRVNERNYDNHENFLNFIGTCLEKSRQMYYDKKSSFCLKKQITRKR